MAQSASFSFNWDKSAKTPPGKVFRRKQKPQPTVSSNSHTVEIKKLVNTPAVETKKLVSNVVPTIETNIKRKVKSFVKPIAASEKPYIKRKRNKDKNLNVETESSAGGQPISFSLFNQHHKDIDVKGSKGLAVNENVFASSGSKFDGLQIHKYLISNLEKHNFTSLTNVQEKAIPTILSGKNTLIRSQTGSGKTLTYAVPIIDALQSITPKLRRTDGVQAIVVVPTRELALQTHELFNKINTFQWIVVSCICGGENRKSEKDRIRKGINVLIGTPGRLLDHVRHTAMLKVNRVRCLVLDEADRLLDMGFRKDIVSLVQELKSDYDPLGMLKITQDTPNEERTQDNEFPLRNIHSKQLQTILLSATLTKGVSELAEFVMKEHVYVDALDKTDETVVNDENLVIPSAVKQEFIITYVKHKLFTLCAYLVSKSKSNSKIFVFMASRDMVEFHYDLFTNYLVNMPKNRGKDKTGDVVIFNDSDSDDEEEVALDIQFFKLHGSMDQKYRKGVFEDFRSAKRGVLLCTDVAARGLDVPTADCIVQYTGPQTDEDYVHRVGRTGRVGHAGNALIFLTHEEQEYVTHLQKHKAFLKQRDPDEFLKYLCDLMEEPSHERAAEALQKRFETMISKNKDLHKSACFAYSSWSRFYNTYPSKLRPIFDFKKVNLGHYATSFGLRDTPSQIARTVRGEVVNAETPRLNRKLTNHKEDDETRKPKSGGKKRKSVSLITSEYSSGLEPANKKKQKKTPN